MNDVPSVNDSTFTIVEDVSGNTEVGIIEGLDLDGDTLSYSITLGNDDGLFAIDLSSGVIKVATAVDYETASTHRLIVTATDTGSLSSSATVTVTVTDVNDNTPVFSQKTYLSTLNDTDTLGTQLVIATATDADIKSEYSTLTYSLTAVPNDGLFVIDPSSGTVMTVGSLVNSFGSHSLTLSAFDGTNTGTATLSVTVKDSTAPVITINGSSTVIHEAGTVYTDEGARAVDVVNGSVKVTSTMAVRPQYWTVWGDYTIIYYATDASSNSATVTRMVKVVDTTGPVISLLGEVIVKAAFGLEFIDSGAKALDLSEGDVSDQVTVESNLNTAKLGTYEIRYSVTDRSGNSGESVTRVVVVEDLVPPVIELIGGSPVVVAEGVVYKELGATAIDDLDGNLTSIITSISDVDTSKPGRYAVKYNVADSKGNEAVEVVREVVVRDGTPPVIALTGGVVVNLEAGEVYIEAGATALDAVDGNLTSDVAIGTPVISKPGVYYVTYDIADSSDNRATQLTRKVVVTDSIPPILYVIGFDSVTVEAGSDYNDLGAVASDSFEGDLTGNIQVSNSVDVRKTGQYIVTYDVSDASGNKANQAVRSVEIKDTLVPVITLIGEVELQIEVGREYSDAGATAVDEFEGNLTGSIQVDNWVDETKPGQYEVRYNVEDSSGNQAEQLGSPGGCCGSDSSCRLR